MDEDARPRPALPDRYPLAGLMRSALGKGRPFRFEARGTSMRPAVRDGDRVTVAPLSAGGPRPGDIVAFADPVTDGVRVHRVVAVEAGRFVLKGDNAPEPDGAFARDELLGVVVRLERGGRDRPLGPRLRAAAEARLSRSRWLGRLARRARLALAPRGGRSA